MRGAGALALLGLALAVAAFFVLGGDGAEDPARSLTLATTTSTDNSGLLKHLLEPWQAETGIRVKVVAVGTGKALELAARGDADLLLVHARAREDAFVEAGFGVDRRDVMWNDFVIAGPPEDPAGVSGMTDAAAALAAIAAKGARFVSRGDDSGTHIRERALWKDAGVDPTGASWYLEAGQGMGPCLTMAGERRAYVLADRGTFLAVRASKRLAVLVEGDRRLANPYGVILVDPARHPHVHHEAARRLHAFLVSPEGQRRIGAFRRDGEVLFHPSSQGN